jgi:hypothetical protein
MNFQKDDEERINKIKNEINIMKELDHDNIIKYITSNIDKKNNHSKKKKLFINNNKINNKKNKNNKNKNKNI